MTAGDVTEGPGGPTAGVIDRRLWSVVARESSRLDVSMGESTESSMRGIVHDAALRIIQEGVARDEGKVALAEKNLTRFLEAMAADARARDIDILDALTIEAAFRLCPLWPIC